MGHQKQTSDLFGTTCRTVSSTVFQLLLEGFCERPNSYPVVSENCFKAAEGRESASRGFSGAIKLNYPSGIEERRKTVVFYLSQVWSEYKKEI